MGRGLIATLGASGSLLAGAACLLLAMSALVAFHGFSDLSTTAAQGSSLSLPAVAARRASALVAAGPGAGAAVLVVPSGLRAGARATPRGVGPGGARRGASRRGLAPSRSPGRAPAPAAAPSGGTSSASAPVVARGTGSGARAPGLLSVAGGAAGSTLEHTTAAVGGAVGPVSPQGAGAIQSAGTGVGEAVRQSADVADGLLRP